MKQAAFRARLIFPCLTAICAGYAPASGFPGADNLAVIVDSSFPAGDLVRGQTLFWLEIYLRTGGDEGWLHDPFFPELIFRKIAAPQSRGPRGIGDSIRSLQADLRAASGSDSAWRSPEQTRLRSLFPAHWDSTAVELCAQRVRFQRGLRERFVQGLERSYRYLPAIESTFAAHGVPARLKFLPHVESSFHPHAYSKVGAAGMWQFMKSTGRRYMQVGYHIDERRDPLISTAAAAKLLRRCHEILGNWPLAVMAYNHGPVGVARAVSATGSTDMDRVLQSYYSNTFGFASRNFYAEFLAASTVAMMADSLFPDLDKWEPLRFRILPLAKAASARSVADWTGLSLAELEEYNLALRPAVFRGRASLPQGYALRLPLTADTALLSVSLAAAPIPPLTPKKAGGGVGAVADKAETRLALNKPSIPEPPPPKRGTGIQAMETEVAIAPKPAPAQKHMVVDSSFSLQLSDWTQISHPWERFRPSVYNLEHVYENGVLTVRVGPEETVSHFAEWSGLPASEIRHKNGLRGSRSFRMNRSIQLPLPAPAAEAFLKRREEYFRGLEEDFYTRYHVAALEPLLVEKGANVWDLTQAREIAFWLFLKHNSGRNLESLMPGDTLSMPVIAEGWRRWGFTRYADGRNYREGVGDFLRGGDTP